MLWFKLARGIAFATGTAGLLLLLGALVAGPSMSLLGAALAWASVLIGAALSAAVGVGSLEDLSGPRRAKLIKAQHPALSARARSAAELAKSPNGSPELIASLLRSVSDELANVPVPALVPAPRHFRTTCSGASALALGCALVLGTREDAASGLYAMLHPAARNEQGALVGLWVSGLRARISYPAALARPAEDVAELERLTVPEGAQIALTLVPRFPVERAVLALGERSLPWNRGEDGAFTLAITAEESGTLSLRARVGNAWVTDPRPRALHVDKDAAPVVELVAPLTDQQAEPEQRVPFVYRARDDHALDGIDLVVQLGPSRERRLRLSSYGAGSTTQRADGSTEVVPAAFGARPGQTLAVWIEARDRDSFGGANVGRSPLRTIRVGEPHQGVGPELELLVAARDLALDTLGDRLEAPLVEARASAREQNSTEPRATPREQNSTEPRATPREQNSTEPRATPREQNSTEPRATPREQSNDPGRARRLAKGTRALIQALSTLANSYAEHAPSDGGATNENLVRDMTRRLGRLMREEAAAVDANALARSDRATVGELEEDVLWLTDLLGRAKLDAAEGALSRLAATRARMRKLLEQLRASDDPGQRAELLAEIARARAELAEIAERLSEAERDVPSDFVNYEALRREAEEDPLEQLERALAEGDLEAAERALGTLDERMANLERGVQGGSEAFRNARFAPRNQALERARAELRELEHSQEQLAKESDRVAEHAEARGAGQRSPEATGERLAAQSEALEKRARDLEAGRVQPSVAETQRTAAQRLRDARDALRQGEVQEAREMAERAASDLESLATELRLDARMFPGHDGSRMSGARKAEELARDAARFAEDVAANAPREPEQLADDERESLRRQAPTQRTLGQRASKLADNARDEGPAGLPGGLERATQAMRAAEGALERSDLRSARGQQREALERLREVSEELEQQARASSGQRSSGEGNGSARAGADEKVAIPQGEGDSRRSELRRRVLDARRAPTPESYERSVERYYQEILR